MNEQKKPKKQILIPKSARSSFFLVLGSNSVAKSWGEY